MHTVGLFVLQRDEKDFFLFDIDGDLHPHRQAIEEQAGFFGLDPEQDVVLIGSLVGCRVLPENPGIILLFIRPVNALAIDSVSFCFGAAPSTTPNTLLNISSTLSTINWTAELDCSTT